MATTAVGGSVPNLFDMMSAMDPNGAIARIIEAVTKKSPMLQSMAWKEGNLPTGHKITTRTALPSLKWRRLNEGIPATKGKTSQVVETCGQLAGLSKVDTDLARINGNEAAFRASQDKAFIASFANQLESALFYSSTKDTPEQIQGLIPRLDSLSGNYGKQIIDCQIASGGSPADQTSMVFVVWGDDTVHGIYPKGMPAGLQSNDMGKQLVLDASNNQFSAWVTEWKWNLGVCVEDYRYLVRLANIDTSAIVGTGKLLIEDMIKAYHQVQDWSSGRGAIYCNRLVATYLHLQAQDTTKNSTLTLDNIGGMPIVRFLGVPIYVTDGLVNTEDIVA